MAGEETVLKITPEHKEVIVKVQGYISYLTGKQVSQSEACYVACKVLLRLLDLYKGDETGLEMIHDEIDNVVKETKG